MRWQSSKLPATRNAATLSPKRRAGAPGAARLGRRGTGSTTRKPGRRWKAAATAAPVSPEVATSTVLGRAGPARRRPGLGEEARAEVLERGGRPVEELEQRGRAVAERTSGASKVNAARRCAAASSERLAVEEGREQRAATLGQRRARRRSRPAPRRAAALGHEQPAVRREPARRWRPTARRRGPRACACSRIASTRPRAAGRVDRRHEARRLRGRRAAKAGCMAAPAAARPPRRVEPREDARARAPEMLAPSAPASSAACLTSREAGDERGAARLHQHVAEAPAMSDESPREAARQHQREALALRHEVDERVGAAQRRARLPRLQHEVRVHQRAREASRAPARAPAVLGGAITSPPSSIGADVVAVPAAAGHRLAFQAQRVERRRAQRRVEQRVGGDQRGTAEAAEPPMPEPSAMPLSISSSKPTARPSARRSASSARAGGVVLGVERQVGDHAAMASTRTPALVVRRDGDAVARPDQAVAEDVEAHRDVADRRRRERASRCAALSQPRPQRRAATRSRSANTPAAVTSGPAPGPCTTSGLSR